MPPRARAASATIDRPIPVPSMLRPPLLCTRWNRSKTSPTSDSGMPTPVSVTRSRIWSSLRSRVTPIDPSRVNLSALATRFSTIFSQSSGSTCTMPSAGSRCVSRVTWARSAAEANGWSRSRVSSARSVASRVACSPSVSIRATSSSPFTMRRSRWALLCISSRSARPRVAVRPVRTSSNGPSSRVSGVRNSWLTLDRKAVFAASRAASASSRDCSRARSVATVRICPTWSATNPTKPSWSASNGRSACGHRTSTIPVSSCTRTGIDAFTPSAASSMTGRPVDLARATGCPAEATISGSSSSGPGPNTPARTRTGESDVSPSTGR